MESQKHHPLGFHMAKNQRVFTFYTSNFKHKVHSEAVISNQKSKRTGFLEKPVDRTQLPLTLLSRN